MTDGVANNVHSPQRLGEAACITADMRQQSMKDKLQAWMPHTAQGWMDNTATPKGVISETDKPSPPLQIEVVHGSHIVVHPHAHS